MKLQAGMVPLATAMIQLAEQVWRTEASSSPAFLCYWTAFANIYTVLAAQSGLRPHFGLRQNGTLRTRKVDAGLAGPTVKMAEVYPPTEKAKLDNVLKHFSEDLKHRLMTHPSTHFFVYRTPMWDGCPLERDAFKQRLNGVINIGATVDARYPVWCPLNASLYKQYMHEKPSPKAKNVLSKQILDLLTTIHLNLLQGTRNALTDEQVKGENSATVVEKAWPLLAMIVLDFIET
jgi:hypothetical protein